MAAVKSNKPTSNLKAGKKKKVNKWLIIGGIAAAVVIGIITVRYSGASDSRTFTVRPSQMSGGQLVTKSNGTQFRVLESLQYTFNTKNRVLAELTQTQVSGGTKICVDAKAVNPKNVSGSRAYVHIEHWRDAGSGGTFKGTGTISDDSVGTVCTEKIPYDKRQKGHVYVYSSGSIAITSIHN